MSSQHKLNGQTVRPEPEELTAARPHFPAGRSLETFVRASLRALADRPDEMLALIDAYWPPEKTRGRPRKDAQAGGR